MLSPSPALLAARPDRSRYPDNQTLFVSGQTDDELLKPSMKQKHKQNKCSPVSKMITASYLNVLKFFFCSETGSGCSEALKTVKLIFLD